MFHVSRFTFHEKGFTLVEMIVVIGIMVILGGTVFVNFRGSEKRVYLDNAAAKVAQDIRLAKEMSLRTQDDNILPYTCSPPPGNSVQAYGIRFTTGQDSCYMIFAECHGDQDYVGNECDNPGKGPGNRDRQVEIIPLAENVLIDSITDEGGTSLNAVDIVFVPPNPTIYIEGIAAGKEAVIFLALQRTTKKITITNAGTVKVE